MEWVCFVVGQCYSWDWLSMVRTTNTLDPSTGICLTTILCEKIMLFIFNKNTVVIKHFVIIYYRQFTWRRVYVYTAGIHRWQLLLFVRHLGRVCLHENDPEFGRYFSTQWSTIKMHKSNDCRFKTLAVSRGRLKLISLLGLLTILKVFLLSFLKY